MTSSSSDRQTPLPRRRRVVLTLVWFGAFAVFAWTAYPTITWWDSSSFSLAAATLGVTPPPGSLLLTLLGWTITRIPYLF